MDKKEYVPPVLRDIPVWQESCFLASGNGEDATPGDGLWDDDDFN